MLPGPYNYKETVREFLIRYGFSSLLIFTLCFKFFFLNGLFWVHTISLSLFQHDPNIVLEKLKASIDFSKIFSAETLMWSPVCRCVHCRRASVIVDLSIVRKTVLMIQIFMYVVFYFFTEVDSMIVCIYWQRFVHFPPIKMLLFWKTCNPSNFST